MSYPIAPKTKNAVLEIARLQIGVQEYPMNSNSCKYNDWYYGKKIKGAEYPWCMVFVQWVFHEAGYELYKTASCGALLSRYKRYAPDQVIYENFQPGDILIFDFSGKRAKTTHTGICTSVKGGYVYSIDGNTGDYDEANGGAVLERKRPIAHVTAAIRPKYAK